MTVYQFRFLGRKYYYRCNSPEECREWATTFLKIPPWAIRDIKEVDVDMLWIKDYHIQTDKERALEDFKMAGAILCIVFLFTLLVAFITLSLV